MKTKDIFTRLSNDCYERLSLRFTRRHWGVELPLKEEYKYAFAVLELLVINPYVARNPQDINFCLKYFTAIKKSHK